MGARKQKTRSPQPSPPAAPPPPETPPVETNRRTTFWPLWIALTAIGVRIVYFIQYVRSPLLMSLGPDDRYYLDWAKRIAAGDWLGSQVFEQGPLYPYLLAGLFSLLGEASGLVYLLQLLGGVLMCLLIFDAARRLFDPATATMAGLLAALYGPFVFYECMVMKSFLSPLLTTLMLWAAVRYRDANHSGWLWLAGAAVGLAALVQENHLLLLAPLALWVWQQHGSDDAKWQRRAVRAALPLLAAAICIAPATWRNWMVGRELVLVTAGGGEVFYMAHGPSARPFYNPPDFVVAAAGEEHEDFRREARRRTGAEMSRGEASRYWFGEGLSAITADPLRSIQLTIHKAAVLLGDYDVPDSQSYTATREFVTLLKLLPSFGCIGGLALVGAALAVRSWRQHWLPIGIVAAFTLSVLLTYNFGRMRLGMMPAMIVLAAHAAVWTWRAIRERKRRWQGVAAAAAAVALSLAMFYPLLAGDFELTDRKIIARLALRGGRYDLAEENLAAIDRALANIPATESASGQYLYQIAEIHQMLGQLYSRTDRAAAAVDEFAKVRQLPLRDEYRESLLLENAGVLQQHAATTGDATVRRSITSELASTAGQLRRLNPQRLEYWSLAAVYPEANQDRAALASGLEQAWTAVENPSPQQQGWYWLGRAALATADGDDEAAAEAAARASQVWPQSPFASLLDQWRQSP